MNEQELELEIVAQRKRVLAYAEEARKCDDAADAARSDVRFAAMELAKLNEMLREAKGVPETCHADRDGDCSWVKCPQKVNYQSGCPLFDWDQEGL